mgnify:CR=1 FL=1
MIQDICKLTKLSFDNSLILYNHFKWRKDLLEEKWFSNPEEIAIEAGFILKSDFSTQEEGVSEVSCQICVSKLQSDAMETLPCKHHFCRPCLGKYINNQVRNI